MFYKDNWLSWIYDGVENGSKLSPQSTFELVLNNTITEPVDTYYNELINNAKLIRDTFTGEFDLLFSGGIDSEVVLRIYHSLNIPVNVFVFRYENNYNYRDVNSALSICNELSITPKIIDFNLQKFFENDAHEIFSKIYCHSSGRLPHLKMSEYLDNLPIYGSGEPYWRRTNRDTSSQAPWILEFDEGARAWSVYHKTIGRPAICDWYEYSPQVLLSHMQTPVIKDLISDNIHGRFDSNRSKIKLHKEYWPTLINRQKLVGFEGDKDPSIKSKPEFMLEFDREFITDRVISKVDLFTPEQLFNSIGYPESTDHNASNGLLVD
jgi:hypothetical protein